MPGVTPAQSEAPPGRTGLRLIGVTRGDPYSPFTSSGVASHLLDALDRHYGLVGRMDVGLAPWQRAIVAAATVHPSRTRWQERFYKNALAFRFQSVNSRRALRQAARSGPIDAAFQVYGLFRTIGAPFALYEDNTYDLTLRYWPEGAGSEAPERWLRLERELYQAARHVFVTHRQVAESVTLAYGVPPERVSVVGGGANFALPEVPPRQGEQPQPTILFVGREYRRKGGDILVEAFRRVRERFPTARLQIVGTSEADPGPGIEVIGRVDDRATLATLYRQASVFCLPSRFEPYAGVVSEAMAYALPVVCTRVGGLPDLVVEGETGLLVPPEDAAALGDALIRVLGSPAYAATLGQAGRRRVEEHLTWDRTVERMAPVLDRWAAARPTSTVGTPGQR